MTGDCTPLIGHLLLIVEYHGVTNKARGRLAEHHSTGRRDGLHSLRHSDLLTDRGVTGRAGTYLTGDYLAGVETDPQLQCDPVALVHGRTEIPSLQLNVKRREAGAKRVVLQRDRCAEHRHDPVPGELVDRSAIALYDRRRPLEQLGHDLAQPFRTDCGGDVHGVHDVGEQHRHLLVLSGRRVTDRRPHRIGCRTSPSAVSSAPQDAQLPVTSILWHSANAASDRICTSFCGVSVNKHGRPQSPATRGPMRVGPRRRRNAVV